MCYEYTNALEVTESLTRFFSNECAYIILTDCISESLACISNYKTIVLFQVEDLHNLVSEIRSGRSDRLRLADECKLQWDYYLYKLLNSMTVMKTS